MAINISIKALTLAVGTLKFMLNQMKFDLFLLIVQHCCQSMEINQLFIFIAGGFIIHHLLEVIHCPISFTFYLAMSIQTLVDVKKSELFFDKVIPPFFQNLNFY